MYKDANTIRYVSQLSQEEISITDLTTTNLEQTSNRIFS